MSTIADKIQRIATTKENIKNAIRDKGIVVNDSTPFGAYSSLINSIKTVNDVVLKFYDYNGELLYSYTKEEANALTELPTLPEHTGLICQGWNWSLEDIKTEINNNTVVNVGAMFTTDDGYTRYYISLEPADNKEIYIEYSVPVSIATVKIDWGDGVEEEIAYSSGNSYSVKRTHTYESAGDYVIRIWSDKNISLGAYYSNSNSAGISNTSILKKVELGNTIGSLRTYAFYSCVSLNSITIPNSVTSIGSNAFKECSSLTSITIPNSVTSVGASVFNGCYSLNSITIPNSVTSIGASAFSYCYSLNSITIPNSVTSIGASAFYNCYALNSITIPNSVTSVGASAFYSCYSLNSITIPDSVTSIGDEAFSGCRSLTSVTISNSVTSIGAGVFNGCSSLNSITIPNSVTSIGGNAFTGCYSLTSITIPDSVTSIGSAAFSYCSSLNSITIPNSVISMGAGVFYNCSSLNSITIPNSVISIGANAFYNCYSLNSITIPDSVTSIGEGAFYGCRKLVFASIPDVKFSYLNTFNGCNSLRYIDLTRMSYPVLTYNCSGSGFISSSVSYKILINDLLYDNWCNEKQWKSLANKFERGFEVTRIISKSFEAEDVRGNYDYTNIKVTYVVDGIDYFGNVVTNRVYTHTDKVYIGQNKGGYSIEKTVKYTYMGIENTTTITQGAYIENCIICKYNVTSTTSLTSLFYNSSNTNYLTNYFDNMIIDGGDPVAFSKTYTFDTKGIHEVVFMVKEDASITNAYYMFYGISTLIYADLSEYNMTNITTSTSSSGNYAYTFYNCTKLDTLILPETNNYMGYRFLEGCTSLRILIHKNPIAPNTTSNNYVFGGYNSNSYTGYYYRYCKNELWIPYSATGYTSGKWSSNLCSSSYGGFEICKEIIPSTCTELTATANDAYGQQTYTSITLNATTNGFDRVAGNVEGVLVSKTYDSETFEQNTSRTDSINRSFEVNYGDKSTIVNFVQKPWADCIIAKYDVTSAENRYILSNNFSYISYFDAMLINGKPYTPTALFNFSKTGLYEIIFIVKPDTTITSLAYLFYNLGYFLKYVDLTYIDMSNITSTSNTSSNSNRYMCYGCTGLKEIIYPESVKAMGYLSLYNCVNLNKITIKSLTAPSTSSNSFYYSSTSYCPGYNNRNKGINKLYVPVNSTGYDSGYWSSHLYNTSYCGFTKETIFEPSEVLSIQVTPEENIAGTFNTCFVQYDILVIGYDGILGRDISATIHMEETVDIEYNTSETENKVYNKSFTYMGYTVDYEIIQGPWLNAGYTVDLNNNSWRESTIVSNPDPDLYSAVYESNSNYNVDSGVAYMYIDIYGYDTFEIYIAANSETGYDKVYASEIDVNNNYYTGNLYGDAIGDNNPVHNINKYKLITYTNLNKEEHRIRIGYTKDGSVNTGYDRGFLIIPKQ